MGNIIAIEGPAGSGKSTLVKGLASVRPDLVTIERPTFGRSIGPALGSWSSSYLEYQAIAGATMTEHTFLTDRFLLSRWVYRHFEGIGTGPSHSVDQMLNSYSNLHTTAMAEMVMRTGLGHTHPLCVFIIVLLPSLHNLIKQRRFGGKHYPFGASKELYLYSELAEELDNSDRVPDHLYIHTAISASERSLDGVLEVITDWEGNSG